MESYLDPHGDQWELDGGEDGIWSKDIEDAFEEALAIYPPCGRRKIILSDEGKMYGRNELIARYIKMRTGKTRSRKQVSSHIQVLARKKQREISSKVKSNPECAHLVQNLEGLSSAEIVATHGIRERASTMGSSMDAYNGSSFSQAPWAPPAPSSKLKLVMSSFSTQLEYSPEAVHYFVNMPNSTAAFLDPEMELVDVLQIYDKFPGLRQLYQTGPKAAFFLVKFWADMSFEPPSSIPANPLADGVKQEVKDAFGDSQYCFTNHFESLENMTIQLSTRIFSLGKQVVEKLQIEYAVPSDSKFTYQFSRSPVCPYMVSFIEKLRQLNNRDLMNRVLENFSALQIVRNVATSEVLFCTAYIFEVAPQGQGSRQHLYKLVDSQTDPGVRRYTA